jgi:hypothetical protein
MKYNIRARNVFLAVACVFILGHFASSVHGRYMRAPSQPRRGVYPSGMVLSDSEQLGLDRADRTILVLTASTCHFCRASLPFYRKLTAAARRTGTRVVAVTYEDPAFSRNAHLQVAGSWRRIEQMRAWCGRARVASVERSSSCGPVNRSRRRPVPSWAPDTASKNLWSMGRPGN